MSEDTNSKRTVTGDDVMRWLERGARAVSCGEGGHARWDGATLTVTVGRQAFEVSARELRVAHATRRPPGAGRPRPGEFLTSCGADVAGLSVSGSDDGVTCPACREVLGLGRRP